MHRMLRLQWERNDSDAAEHILGNCFFLQILISIILTVILLFGNRTFLLAFGASENTIEYAVNYMNIYAVGTIFVQLTLGMNMFITTQGFAKTGMLSVLIGAVDEHCSGSTVFIFALHLGVRGAALATILSQALSCIWVLMLSICGKKTILHIKPEKESHPETGDYSSLCRSRCLPHLSCRLVRVSSPYVSTLLCLKYGGRYRSWCHDDPHQCHAVRNAATAGSGTGCTT